MTQEKPRILWLDIAKAFAIFAVVVGHNLLIEDPLRQFIFSFHMPLFFILAGYTFRVKPMKEVLAKSTARLLLPYVLIFAFMTTLDCFRAVLSDKALPEPADVALQFVFASGVDIEMWNVATVGVLWFLVALFAARVIFGFGMSVFKRFNVRNRYQALFWLLLGLIGIFLGEPTKMLPFTAEAFGDMEHVILPLSLDIVMVACFLMYVGYVFRECDGHLLLKKWTALFMCVAVWIACLQFSYLEFSVRSYEFWVCSILGACAGTFCVCWLSHGLERLFTFIHMKWFAEALGWIGKNSMTIYCLHAIDIYFLGWYQLAEYFGGTPDILGPYLLAGIVRFAMVLGLAIVVKRA